MTKPIKVTPRGCGRPAFEKDPHVTTRMPAEMINPVQTWAAATDAGRSEAIRRLGKIGLSKSAGISKPRVLSASKRGADRAAELVVKIIDRPLRR